VREFGAVADGVTDDSAAIQAALSRAGSGGQVYFPDGVYALANPVTSYNADVTIYGESWNAELVRTTANTVSLLTVDGAGSLVTSLTVNGNGNTVQGQYADLAIGGANTLVDYVQVLNSHRIGISVAGNHCCIRACTVIGLANANIQSYGIWAVNYNTGIMIRDNYITNTGIDGIGISGNGYQVIGNYLNNCHAYNGTGGGQLVVYNNAGTTINGLISGNTIGPGNGPQSCGMELNGSDTTVVGNNINNQKFLGLVATGNGWLITGNTITNTGTGGTTIGAAIWMNPGNSSFVVSGNRLIDDQTRHTQYCGVFVDNGPSDSYTITGNLFAGNVRGTVIDNGTGLNKVIRDNVGIDDVIPTLTAAPTLTLPINPVVMLSGSTDIRSINGAMWSGRSITFLTETPVTFVAGGNIANTVAVPAATPVVGTFNGGRWYFR
jgi:hypothetical protein